ncbi:Uncharacterized protein Fot_42885 [Forsythia ovata]|uniref:Uncharacterized protein n=1 Tax=Forsythia ovata TaxID=205694 RepID=A0ABD1RP85_9LAMI
MAEPIRAVCLISKLVFNVNYFRMVGKKRIEQFTGVIHLGDFESEVEIINFMMEKLTPEETADLNKQMEESLRLVNEKALEESFGQMIGLAGLAAKKISLVVKSKDADKDQKKTLSGLSPKVWANIMMLWPYPIRDKMTLVPAMSAQGIQFMVEKKKVGAKQMEKKTNEPGKKNEKKYTYITSSKKKSTYITSSMTGIGASSKHSLKNEDDIEILEDESLSKKAKKSRTAASKLI